MGENVLVLQDILMYHYTYRIVSYIDLIYFQLITMANGKDIMVTPPPTGGIFINENTEVLVPDGMATNGVIHVVDNVLIPPGLDVEGFLEACLATDPPTNAPTNEPTPEPTRSSSSKSSKKGRARKK